MEVFRITRAKHANELFGPGKEGRWNEEGEQVVYTSASRSLACLENLAHKGGRGKTMTYRTMVIYIPDSLAIQQVNIKDLPSDWNEISLCKECQQIGSAWYVSKDTAVLRVPSAVIPDEFNYVLNTRHPDFKQIEIIRVLPFSFDQRLIQSLENESTWVKLQAVKPLKKGH